MVTQEDFMKAYLQALEVSKDKVFEHSDDGENEAVSLPQMFPHGVQDLIYELYKKINRSLGYEKRGNHLKVQEEAVDILNYAAFLLAWYETHKSVERIPPKITKEYKEYREIGPAS